MNIKFKDINPGMNLAKITSIKQENGPYGTYLRFNFTVTDGDLKDWSFYGIVKPTPLKQSKFYRWITTILGKHSDQDFAIDQLIGKHCRILLKKKVKSNKTYFSVVDLV